MSKKIMIERKGYHLQYHLAVLLYGLFIEGQWKV